MVSENFETTRTNQRTLGRKKTIVFFLRFWSLEPRPLGLGSRRFLQASPGGRCASATAVCPGIFSCSAGKSFEASGAEVAPKNIKKHIKNTPKLHPNLSHEFIPCLFCIFLGFVLVLVFGRILWKRSYFATEILGITHYTALQNSWTSFDFMLSTLEFEIFRTSSLVSLRFRFSIYGETCGVTEGGGRTAAHWIRLREEERRRRRDPYEMNSENIVQFKHLKQGIHFAHISTFSYPYCLGLIGCTFLGWLLVRVGRRLDRTYL